MPNHCYNRLSITGPKEEVERFIKQAEDYNEPWHPNSCDISDGEVYKVVDGLLIREGRKKKKFSFHAFVPVPIHILRQGFSGQGHEWTVENWGTKWGAYDIEFDEPTTCGDEKTHLYAEYRFTTAWSEGRDFWDKLFPQFPNLEFELRYCEPGMAFAGYLMATDGEVYEEGSYESGDEQYRDIAEEFGCWYGDEDEEEEEDFPSREEVFPS